MSQPTYGTVGWADLTRPESQPELRHVRPLVSGRVATPWHEARAELSFLPVPHEELSDLDLRRATRASAGWAGISITGAAPA